MQTGSDEDEENLGDDRNISSLEIWMKKQANIPRHDVLRDIHVTTSVYYFL